MEEFSNYILEQPSYLQVDDNAITAEDIVFQNRTCNETNDTCVLLDISQSSNHAMQSLEEDSLASFPGKFEQMRTSFNDPLNLMSLSSNQFDIKKVCGSFNDDPENFSESNPVNNEKILTPCQYTDEPGCSGLQNVTKKKFDGNISSDSNDNASTDFVDTDSESDEMQQKSHGLEESGFIPDARNDSRDSVPDDSLDLNSVSDSQESYSMPSGMVFPSKQTKNPDLPLSRKRQRYIDKWKASIAKKAKCTGNVGVSKVGKPINKKSMGMGCGKCRFSCNKKMSEEQRQAIFKEFWSLVDHTRQWDYMSRFIYIKNLSGNNRKKLTNEFFLQVSGTLIKVCRTMFMQTLGITKAWIKTVNDKLKNSNEGVIRSDQRGKSSNRPNKIPASIKISVRDHIQSFPRIESHYCRQTSNKTYLSENLSLKKMYEKYKDSMLQKEITNFASEHSYRQIFNKDFNIEFHKPKKDLCDICTAYKYMQDADKINHKQEYNLHIKNKNRARELMAQDKKEAQENANVCTACFDVEQTLTTPRSNVSMNYYKRKLNIYNYTIYEMDSHQGWCYVWNETIGGKGANEIASCLYDFLKKKAASGVKIFKFYSDNCGAQNRNKMLFSMYIRAADSLNITITHRYLEKGHTYNEGDSMHATIENSCKNLEVFTQSGWCEIMKNAKKNAPLYLVNEVVQENILDFRPLANDQNWKAVRITNLREIRVQPKEANVFVKYDYDAEATSILIPTKKCVDKEYPLVRLHVKKIDLDNEKKNDLQHMCSKGIIPSDYHEFYKSLTE